MALIDSVPRYGVYIVSMKLTIGKLAQASEVSVETVRFYERKGILKQPRKTRSYREYPQSDIKRIRFIKRAQEVGFTLKETKELLDLRIQNQAKCGDVIDKAEEKIEEINRRIHDLQKMRESLTELIGCCSETEQPLSQCPVLDGFFQEEER